MNIFDTCRAIARLALVAAAAIGLLPAAAQAQDYYAGKTVRIVVPHPAGGTFDTLARLVAQHMPDHVPGKPTMIVENLPGGGGITGTRNAFNAKPDGLTLFHGPAMAAVQEQLGQYGGVKFSEFGWLGSVAGASYALILKSELADQPLEKLRADQTPIKLGINGPGGLIHETSKFVRSLSGLNIQLISGYQGAGPIVLALRQGEVDGLVGGIEFLSDNPLASEMYKEGSLKPILAMGGSTPPDEFQQVIASLPKLQDGITDSVDRQALDSIVDNVAITRVFGASPNTPPEQLQILRTAFDELMKDESFIADISKAGFRASPVGYAETTEKIKALSSLSPEVVERIRKILE